MSKLRQLLSKFTQEYSLKKIIILATIIGGAAAIVTFREILIANAESFLKNYRSYLVYTVPISIVIGFYHAWTGNAKEHALFIFKFLGPILASPLTCLTYAVVINSSFALMYLICFDVTTLQNYDMVDKTTLTYTLLLLVTWSVVGIVKIFIDCIKLSGDKNEGEILRTSTTEEKHHDSRKENDQRRSEPGSKSTDHKNRDDKK